ncbi:MAG: MFS transporter [Haloarculaceae archaeon]
MPEGLSRVDQVLLIVGMVIVGFNLRLSLTSVSPLLEIIQRDLGLSYAVASLLTTLPTVCFGVFAFAATPLSRTIGRNRGILVGILLITVGTLLRLWGYNIGILFLTTLLVGAGIAVCQTLLPAIISAHFVDRAALVTGLYTASLTIGAGVASSVTSPLFQLFGSWPAALAVWGVLGLVAVIIWIPHTISQPSSSTDSVTRHPWLNGWAILLMLFFGLQSLVFYTTITWLSPYYIMLGWTPTEAGLLLTMVLVAQLGGTLGLAPLSDRHPDRRPWLALVLALCCVGFTTIVFVPLMFPWIWASILGLGLGGIFALSLTLPVDLTESPRTADQLTAMMTGGGYLIAAAGPFLGGVLRDIFDGYAVTFLLLLGISIALFGSTILFSPKRQVS